MKKKILLVDDDALVLKSVKNLLLLKDYEIEACKNAREALRAFQTQGFDLVICDIRMPEESGIYVMKQIRKHETSHGLSPTPLIVITGYASEDVPIEAIELGVDGYVLKPFDQELFFATVEKVLSKSDPAGQPCSSLEEALNEIKTLVSRFHDDNEREVFQNEKLKNFIHELEESLIKIEKEFLKLS